MIEKLSIADGKYILSYDDGDGRMTVTRYGEPWDRNFTGDNVVYHLFTELLAARQELARLGCSAQPPEIDHCLPSVGVSRN